VERDELLNTIRKASGRLLLGAFDGGGEDSLWTIRDRADRTITCWIYRQRSLLCARVTGPAHTRAGGGARGGEVKLAEMTGGTSSKPRPTALGKVSNVDVAAMEGGARAIFAKHGVASEVVDAVIDP
jgi:hypothetical protein